MKLVNRQLRKALPHNPGILARLHSAFEEADVEGTGLLHRDHWQQAFGIAGVCQPSNVIDLNGDGYLDYYGFACHVLGTESHTVELALYDLSQGAAKWVPAALLGGHKFDGIWHSGIRAFGKEYWFGGAILESKQDDIPFGEPTRVVQLGSTLRTREELLEFLRNDVYIDYNPNSYDVLRRNCNHFSNELAQFLLHGKQIPEEVLMQPEWAKTTSIVRVLRPALNHWLGGFGDEVACSPTASPCSPSTPRIVSRIDDMTQEWRNRLQVGDTVLHRARFIDRPWVVRIVDLARTRSHRTAEIVFFRPTGTRWEDVQSMLSLGGQWRWEVVRQSVVPLHEFFPLLDEAETSVQILKAGLTLNNDRFGGVLQRLPSASFRPACPRGHKLQPLRGAPSWFCTVPPCSVCGHPVASNERYSCPRCNVVVCGACFARGSNFAGGGVFADILTPELARELLADAGWLRYRARAYFFKADHNSTGLIDKPKARRVNERLAAELRARPLSDSELAQEMRRLSPYNGTLLEPDNPVDMIGEPGKSVGHRKVPLVLDEESFEEFFGTTLSIALDTVEQDCRRET
uniref:EF-hand domain-containing protein n=1 Tax=Alexandrium catenella TaxID=2925 RepID=A0A7S1LCW0_ALECA